MEFEPVTRKIPIGRIETGDLLAWRGNNLSSFRDTIIKGVRFFTKENFGHVGIAWKLHDGLADELIVIEATIPKIRVRHITSDEAFYALPMNVKWEEKNKEFLVSKIGLPYGLVDALRAGVGLSLPNDFKWQCAEYAHHFYRASGIFLPEEYTPGKLVKNAERHRGERIAVVVGHYGELPLDSPTVL